ncbi:unnamed protein product, partial [Meganyctiphanes norvegica]
LWSQHAPGHYNLLKGYSYPQGFTRQILCAGRPGVDACKGDSGGPLAYHTTHGSNYVIGIVSKGIPTCADFPIIPGIYTNVPYYVDWIKSKTGIPYPAAALFPGSLGH